MRTRKMKCGKQYYDLFSQYDIEYYMYLCIYIYIVHTAYTQCLSSLRGWSGAQALLPWQRIDIGETVLSAAEPIQNEYMYVYRHIHSAVPYSKFSQLTRTHTRTLARTHARTLTYKLIADFSMHCSFTLNRCIVGGSVSLQWTQLWNTEYVAATAVCAQSEPMSISHPYLYIMSVLCCIIAIIAYEHI